MHVPLGKEFLGCNTKREYLDILNYFCNPSLRSPSWPPRPSLEAWRPHNLEVLQGRSDICFGQPRGPEKTL